MGAGLISAQTTRLIDLPDIPGQVLQVWAVYFDNQNFSANGALTHALRHDVNLGQTLSLNDTPGQWVHAEMPQDVDGPGQNHIEVRFWPDPYELIGPQRWDIAVSGGSFTPFCTIHYTTRREPNVTKFNLLRALTSFERD